jgi:hypothetical protein
MPLFKFCCCLVVYLKLYLRLKFLEFHNHFLHKLYVLLRFSCLICMFFCLDDLYGVFSGFLHRFRNRREKIYRNMLYFL